MGRPEEATEDPVVEAANIAARVANRYARRVFWADPDDLEQEAMVAALNAVQLYDESMGIPFAAYVARACMRQVGRAVLRASAPVSSRRRDKRLIGLQRVPLCEELEEAAPWADAVLVDADWKFRVHEQLDFVLNAGQGDQARVALRVLLDEEKPARVAEELGLPVARVYKITERARSRLAGNECLFHMLKEIDE